VSVDLGLIEKLRAMGATRIKLGDLEVDFGAPRPAQHAAPALGAVPQAQQPQDPPRMNAAERLAVLTNPITPIEVA
jgi:hypothetical protein